MEKTVLAFERSPLARNVYNMILSKLCETHVEMIDNAASYDMANIDANLVIFGLAQHDKKTEIIKYLKKIPSPVIIFIKTGMMQDWRDLETDTIKVLERPFYPDDFLKTVRKLWEM